MYMQGTVDNVPSTCFNCFSCRRPFIPQDLIRCTSGVMPTLILGVAYKLVKTPLKAICVLTSLYATPNMSVGITPLVPLMRS